ncbi:MAG: methanogenesis marker 1 protein [Syntrophaceae bacterium]|nr:methanogenesis marker 1 protein [Syntrophaceae bacterium]
MPPLSLKPCPKAYILETHRSRPPAETLAFITRLEEKVGMLDIRDAERDDRIGLPVFTCRRVRPDGSVTRHTGKGITPIQARVSLTMESVERHASEFREVHRERLVRNSYRRLSRQFNVLPPPDLILSQSSEYDDDRPIFWIRGYDLLRNEDVYLPACAVFHPFHLDDILVIHTHTNGIAAGNTLEEAIEHGITEVIERDAWSIAQYRAEALDALSVEAADGNAFLLDIIEKFCEAGIEIVAKNITSDVGVPTIAAFSRDMQYDSMIPIDGFGTHLDPRVALARALLEIVTTRALFLQTRGLAGLQEGCSTYFREEEEDYRFFSYRQIGLGDMNADFRDDILDDVHLLMSRCMNRGLDRVIAVDLTDGGTGIPTVRVIVPGMEAHCFDRSRRGDRLYAAPDGG